MKNNNLDRTKLQQMIHDFEYKRSGLCFFSGSDIQVRNIKVFKKKNIVTADVVFISDFDEKKERYDNCVYPVDLFTVDNFSSEKDLKKAA